MKKLLIGIIIVLILVLTGITIVKGFQIGSVEILGIMNIKDENEKLDTTVKKATKLASTDYQQKIDELNSALKKVESEKTSYEDLVNVSTESQVESANQIYNNTIDFLWVRIENHAKSEGVTMKMLVTRSSSGAENAYDLNFTATGTYTGIEEFITGIEDDSKLGFKIENFSMVASSNNGEEVEATFVCKNITIKGLSNSTVTTTTTQVDTTNTNTTNTNSSDTNSSDTNSIQNNITNTENVNNIEK